MARPAESADTATVIEVRPAVPEDAYDVARVQVRSWQWAYRGLIAQSYLDSLAPETWAGRYTFGRMGIGLPFTLVAVDGSTICGLATTGLCRDEDLPNFGELMAIYVDPAHVGTGVGQVLITAARRAAARGVHAGRAVGARRQRSRSAVLRTRRVAASTGPGAPGRTAMRRCKKCATGALSSAGSARPGWRPRPARSRSRTASGCGSGSTGSGSARRDRRRRRRRRCRPEPGRRSRCRAARTAPGFLYTPAARMIGVASRNEKRAASSCDRPRHRPATMAMPERLIPGSSARICAEPISTPRRMGISASRLSTASPLCSGSGSAVRLRSTSPAYSTTPLRIRNTAAGMGLPSVVRKVFSRASPARPTGMVPATSSQANRSPDVWIRRCRTELAKPASTRTQSRQKNTSRAAAVATCRPTRNAR